jgi:hypothetical protein
VSFAGAKVGGQFDCSGGKFLGKGEQCLVAEGIEVGGSVFLCDGFEAHGSVVFFGCRIKGSLLVAECEFGQSIKLLHASIEGAFLFDPSKVGGEIDLRDAHVGEWDDRWAIDRELKLGWMGHRLWEWGLHKPLQKRLRKDPQRLQRFERLRQYRLSGLTYNSIGEYLSAVAQENPTAVGLWLAYADGGRYDPQPYEQMARVLKAHGQEDAYREVIIAKRVERRRWANMNPILSFFDFLLLDVPVRYGYKPWRAVVLGILIWLLSGWLFSQYAAAMVPTDGEILNTARAAREYAAQHAPPNESESIRQQPLREYVPTEYPEFKPFYYTMDLFLPLIDLHHEHYWEIDRGRPEAEILLRVQWFVVISGWYLTTLFISSFTGLLRIE